LCVAVVWLISALSACAPKGSETGGTTEQAAVTPAAVVVPANAPAQAMLASRDLAPALDKTRAATTYRIGFDFETGTGDPGQMRTQPYLAFDGDIKGDANHVVYNGGAFTEMLGNSSRVEVVTVDGKTYIKGSNFYGIADAERWYYMPNSGISRPPFGVEDLLQMTGGDVGQARAAGDESVDGLTCHVWRLDVKSQSAPLVEMAAVPDSKDGVSVVDAAEARFVACPDGFVHRMEWSVLSHNSANADDKATIAITVHLFDFNTANIVIAAPPNPLEMR
jgi:hypothetical protein